MKLSLNIGQSELNTDLDPAELQADYFTFGQNFVFRNGKIQPHNGQTSITEAPANFFVGKILFVNSVTGPVYLIMGRTDAYAYDGTAWTSVKSLAGYAALSTNDELLWTVCRIGNIPIVNNPQVFPEYWSPQQSSQILQPLKFDPINTWSAKGFKAKVIRSHNSFLFALGLIESGIELPTSYRWSHPADTNGLPFTWDETDLSAIAGKASISGSGGPIIDGLSLRDSFVIYSESAINILDYVGGQYIWQRRLLSSVHGLISTNAIAEVNGKHYFISNKDIMVNDGNSITSLLTQKVKTQFQSLLSSQYAKNSYTVINSNTKEIWFFFVREGQISPFDVIIYAYDTGKISFRTLLYGAKHACFGPILGSAVTWSTVLGSWSGSTSSWGSSSVTPSNYTVTSISFSQIWALEIPTAGDSFNSIIERTNLSLNGLDTIVTVQRVYPRIRSNGSVSIEIGSQNYLNGPVNYKPAVTFTPNTMRKIDIRATGKLICWRISSLQDNDFTLEGLDIEYVTNGTR
jgi:hypothetical protein